MAPSPRDTQNERPAVAGGEPIRPADRFLVFGLPTVGEAEIAAVAECMRDRWIGTGPRVARFEAAFSQRKGMPHAIAVNSCTAALHLALVASGVGAGDEVITSTMTYCSTVHSILHAGGEPVLVDCDRQTSNISPELIERHLTSKTKAIIVVHMCGRCADMDPIMAIANRHGIVVIEDCAHATEATYRGRPSGTLGAIGCFSFYPTKNLTSVEGGMLLTRNPELADRVRILAHQGENLRAWNRAQGSRFRHYDAVELGFKYNMPDVNAAIGLVQLGKLDHHAARRSELWSRYNAALDDLPLTLPAPTEENSQHARHLYTPLLRLEEVSITRDGVLDALRVENIGAGMHFVPVHRLSYYAARYAWPPERFPNAEFISQRTMSLPLSGETAPEDVDDVCRALRRILTYYRA